MEQLAPLPASDSRLVISRPHHLPGHDRLAGGPLPLPGILRSHASNAGQPHEIMDVLMRNLNEDDGQLLEDQATLSVPIYADNIALLFQDAFWQTGRGRMYNIGAPGDG